MPNFLDTLISKNFFKRNITKNDGNQYIMDVWQYT